MAKSTNGVNKSEEVRKVLRENPKMSTKEVVATLAEKDIQVQSGLVYLIKGKMKAKKRRQNREEAAKVTSSGKADTIDVLRKVKGLAADVGGMKKLKTLVDILSE